MTDVDQPTTPPTVHTRKTDRDAPGVCSGGCLNWLTCENNTERAMFPDNVRLLTELNAYIASELPNERQYEARGTFIDTLEYRCELKVHSKVHGEAQNPCEFIGLRDASRALIKMAQREVERDYFSADVTAKWLEHAKAINKICEAMKCSGNHVDRTETTFSSQDIMKVVNNKSAVKELFKK